MQATAWSSIKRQGRSQGRLRARARSPGAAEQGSEAVPWSCILVAICERGEESSRIVGAAERGGGCSRHDGN